MVRKKVSIRGFLLFLNEKFILSIEHKSAEERSVNQYCNVRIYFNLQQRRMKIMKRIIDELFVTEENRGYSLDDIIAIRIQNGEFYFLGWMENAERYSIQWAKSNSKIERDLLIASDDVYDAITSCKDYNKVENDWLMDDKGNLLNKDDHEYRNPYTAETSYDFSNELENDIPANEKFCFVVSAYYDSEDLPNASVDQMNEAYEVMENLAADEVTTDEYQNSSSSKPDTPKSEEVKTASVSGAVLTAVNGQNPSYIASTDTEGTEIVRESWICKDDGSVNNSDSSDKMKFEAGKTYTYSVTLVAKDGYHFGDSFTATVNGKNATVVHNTDGTITLTDISTVTVPSDPVAVKKIDTVKAANATLTCKAGEKPKFTATIPEGEERYEIVYESWSDGTTTIRSDSADSDFTFEAGKTYKYSIAFRLTEKGIADGYDLTGAKLTLNGKESGVSITESGKTAEYGNAVSVDVPRSDSKPDDSKTDDTKKDDTSKDDGKKEDSKTDDTSKDDSKKDDFSKEDTSKGDVKKDDSNLTDKKKDSTVTEKNTNQKDAQTSDKKDDQNSSNSGSGSNSVKTGDPAVWGLWASLFGSSGIAGAVIRRRKRK